MTHTRTVIQISIDLFEDGGCGITAQVQHGYGGGIIIASVHGKYVQPYGDDTARVIGDGVAQYLRDTVGNR